MAVVLTYPTDPGQLARDSNGVVYAFVATGYTDTPGGAQVTIEDRTISRVLGVGNASAVAQVGGEHDGWYAFSVACPAYDATQAGTEASAAARVSTTATASSSAGARAAGEGRAEATHGASGAPGAVAGADTRTTTTAAATAETAGGVPQASAAGSSIVATVASAAAVAGASAAASTEAGASASSAAQPGAVASGETGAGITAEAEAETAAGLAPAEPTGFRFSPDGGVAGIATLGLPYVQDDPDSPDGNWHSSSGNTVAYDGRFSFPTPLRDLVTGAGLQELRALVRKRNAGSAATPAARLELWNNGVLVRAGADVDVTGEQIISLTWDASELPALGGASVECRVYGSSTGGNDAADTSVDLGALEWNGTMENVGLRDDFTTAIDPLVWEPLYSQGGSYTASIVSGRLRVTGSGYVGKQYVRSVASFSAEAGRYVKAAINVSSASPSARRNLYLIGANEYAFEPVLAYLGEDGEGYPINGPGIRFTNAAGATSEHNFGALGSNSGIVVVEFTDATHVNVYNGSTLCAQLTLDPGATFDVALGLTSTSTTGVTSECDWIETGR